MRAWLNAGLLVLATGVAVPAPARDPMRLPESPAPRGATAAGAPAAPPPPPEVRQLLIVGEKRWVIERGYRRGVGDLLGTARIERIDDSAVIVRQDGRLQRLPLFAGVSKQPAGGDARPPADAARPAPALPAPARVARASSPDRSTRTALAEPARTAVPPR
jgi:hypothetical protein